MGCCSSAILAKRSGSLNSKFNFTLDFDFGDMETGMRPKRCSAKRSFSSRISNSTTTTGLSSAWTMSPIRRSILSRSSNNESMTPTKTKIGTMAILHSVCDDFNEAAAAEAEAEAIPITNQQGHLELEKSSGYHTESSCVSTPSKSCFRRTQDHNEAFNSTTVSSSSSSSSEHISDLKMEMYMMTHSQSIMPKTSSPIYQRRQYYANIIDHSKMKTGASKSYFKWRNYLQSTPAYMLHNVTHIPEAIAGQFSPPDFPAFVDLEDMDSAAKRFKFDKSTTDPMDMDHSLRKCGKDIIGLTISTDL